MMRNYEIDRTVDGKTETLNVIIPARDEKEAIFKAFDLAKIVTGKQLPPDGEWTAREVT
jgi:hypothetical protein